MKGKAKQFLGLVLMVMMVFSTISPAMAATAEVARSECGDHDEHDHADEQGGHQEDEHAGCSDESCGHEHDEDVIIKKTSTSSISKSLAQKQAACSHTWTTVRTKEPTCGKAGTYETKCSKCGAGNPNGNGSIPATGKHTWTVTSTKNATCTANGSKSYKCSVCGQTKTETITKLGHNYKQVTTKAATCGTTGTYESKCSRCGAGNPNGNGTIPATGKHTWDRSAATCTAAKKCKVCGTVGEAAKGHKWNISAANCTTDKKCTVCGTVNAKATGHTWNISAATCTTAKKCTKCGTVGQNALGHNYQQVITKNATCGASGTYESKCSRCGAGNPNGNGTIPATGKHTWDRSAATCTAAKKCTVCGTVGEAAKGHTWNISAANCTTDKKCTVCGTVSAKATGHTWNISAANCTTAKKCTKCGTVGQNALGHNYQQVITKNATCGASGTYESKCSRCGVGNPNGNGTIPATGKHTWDRTAATCTAAKKCTVCGTIGEAVKAHTWDRTAATCTVAKKCTVCGTVGEAAKGHKWNVTAATCTTAKKCTVCGTVGEAAKGHTWNISTATCTTDKKCTVCGYVAAKATGHTWNINAATCTTDKKCTVCGTVSAKATGHIWNISVATCTTAKKCTTCGTVGQNALGHDYQSVIMKEATCGTSGTIESICERCGVGNPNGNGIIPPTGEHEWNRESASCTEEKKCDKCGTVGEPIKDHTWVLEESKRTNHSTDGYDLYRCTVCSRTREMNHNFEWIYLEPDNCISVTALFMCTNPECGYIIDGSVVQNYGGHDFMEPDVDKCEHKCRRCGYVEECHSWIEVTKVDDYECYSFTTTSCEKCGVTLPRKDNIQECHTWIEEIVQSDFLPCRSYGFISCAKCGIEAEEYNEYHIPCDSTWKFSRVNPDDEGTCDARRVLRICPECEDEFLDENTVGGPHTYVEGVCLVCKHEDERYCDAFILYGDEIINTVNGEGIDVEGQANDLLLRCNEIKGVKAKNFKYDALTTEELLDYIDSVRCFTYTGHGDSLGGGMLAFNDNGASLGRESINGRDFSNLNVVTLANCYTAYGDSNAANIYQNSIAYAFCEQGAKVVVGFNVSVDAEFGDLWEEKFYFYYPVIIEKSKSIEDPEQREAYVQECSKDLAISVSCSVVTTYTSKDYSNNVIVFQREGDSVVCRTAKKIKDGETGEYKAYSQFAEHIDSLLLSYN